MGLLSRSHNRLFNQHWRVGLGLSPGKLQSLEKTDRGGPGWGGRQGQCPADSSALAPELLQHDASRCSVLFFFPFFRAFVLPESPPAAL